MKKVIYILFIATIFTSLTFIAPRPKHEVCITDIDCGSAINGTDIETIYSTGYPFTAYTKKVSYTLKQDLNGSIEVTTTKYHLNKIMLNFTFYIAVISFLVFLVTFKKDKNENTRH